MHCDYLNVTVPESDAQPVESELLSIVSSIGASAVATGIYKLTSGGTFKTEPKRGFQFFSASGDFLATLRSHGLYDTYLSAIALAPHNVSLMHVAHDLYGSDSPALLAQIVKRTRKEPGIRLTRKRLNPRSQVRTLFSQSADGRDTGTVYLGTRKSEVWAKVYDKQQERLQNAGQETPPCTRYELSVSGKAGASLKDAHSPAAIFWHFMSEVLQRPPGAPEWVKGGLGYALPPKVALLPAEALKRLVESSPQLRQMFTLSDRIGPKGYERFLRLLHDAYEEHQRSLDQPSDPAVSDVRHDAR